MGRVQDFFAWQVRICRSIDRAIFPAYSVDGNEAFTRHVREALRGPGTLADVAGGKTPFFTPAEASGRGLRVTGIDIDGTELAAAPTGSYVATFVGPIEEVRGRRDHDAVIAQSVLEHVRDGRLAAEGIASFAREGALVLTFCPSRRAWFARLNLLLPEVVKRRVLFFVFPSKRERQGYPAFYDGCTPEELVRNMTDAGIECSELRPFFVSSYFMFFVPLYLFWRLATFPFMRLWPLRYCETFMFIGRAGRTAERR